MRSHLIGKCVCDDLSCILRNQFHCAIQREKNWIENNFLKIIPPSKVFVIKRFIPKVFQLHISSVIKTRNGCDTSGKLTKPKWQIHGVLQDITAFTLMGLIIYDGVVSRAIGNALFHPFSKSIFFAHFSPFFFFVSKALKIDALLRILWKLKKLKKKNKFFFFARWIGGTNEFLSGKIASFIGGELRSWTGLETEKYWILQY